MDLDDITAGIAREHRNTPRSVYLSLPRQLQKEPIPGCRKRKHPHYYSGRDPVDRGEWTGIGRAGTAACKKGEEEGSVKNGCSELQIKEQPLFPSAHRFQLYSRDTGWCATEMGSAPSRLLQLERSQPVQRIVGNNLAVIFAINGLRLSYWSSGNKARLSFLLEKKGKRVVVDVHFEEGKKSRSLFKYQKRYGIGQAYRIFEQNFHQGDTYDQIPYYAAYCL